MQIRASKLVFSLQVRLGLHTSSARLRQFTLDPLQSNMAFVRHVSARSLSALHLPGSMCSLHNFVSSKQPLTRTPQETALSGLHQTAIQKKKNSIKNTSITKGPRLNIYKPNLLTSHFSSYNRIMGTTPSKVSNNGNGKDIRRFFNTTNQKVI